MLQFVCDYCGNIKHPDETWINGVAVENIGTHAARREVVIDPAWRYERSVLPLAVHFCCIDCKESYLDQLFQQPASVLKVERKKTGSSAGLRVVHARKTPITGTVEKRTTTRKTRAH